MTDHIGTVGRALWGRAYALHWTLPELAIRAKIPYRRLLNIKRGRTDPTWSEVNRMAEALDVVVSLQVRWEPRMLYHVLYGSKKGVEEHRKWVSRKRTP